MELNLKKIRYYYSVIKKKDLKRRDEKIEEEEKHTNMNKNLLYLKIEAPFVQACIPILQTQMPKTRIR